MLPVLLTMPAAAPGAEMLKPRAIDKGWKEFTGLVNVTGAALCRMLTLRDGPSGSGRAPLSIVQAAADRCCVSMGGGTGWIAR